MKAKLVLAALIAGLLVASCAGTQNPYSTSPQTSNAKYNLLSVNSVGYTVSLGPGVMTNPSFPLSNVNDGNLNTAWGPASASPTPSLIFDLNEACTVSEIAAKVSLGQISSSANQRVLLDVYAWVGGMWVLIGNDLNPPETVLTTLDVTDTFTDRIRIDFDRTTGEELQLLVCAIDIFCDLKPSPTPTPSMKPTPTPTPDVDCCKVTGGGEVPSLFVPLGAKNDYVSFGFNAQEDPESGAKGQLQVTDHATGERWHIEVTDIIRCDEEAGLVEFVGEVKLTNTDTPIGTMARAIVVDDGEPGTEDTFTFFVGGVLEADDDLKGDNPGGGNLQFHKTNCD